MMRLLINVLITICTAGILTSCHTKSKNNDVTPAVTDTASVKLELFNMVGASALNMNDQWYTNEHGDSFKVTLLNYYISNIVLHGDSTYREANSYHLVEQGEPATTNFDIRGVPYGKYDSITFMIGVDSLHNLTGAQDGDLNPDKNMFWSWTTGYIMLKFEGVSPRSPNVNNVITLHSGGFSGPYNVLKTITLKFPSTITVGKNGENHIHLSANILQMFRSPTVIDFATFNTIHMPGADAKTFADNYAGMFSCSYAGL